MTPKPRASRTPRVERRAAPAPAAPVVDPPAPARLFIRSDANPILTAANWPNTVNTIFNPGATIVDGDTVLLCRVEDRRGISSLWVARSADGVTGWRIDPEPILAPRLGEEAEAWGLEDARVVRADELDAWVITCTCYGPAGPAVYLATTKDFVTIDQRSLIMPPEDKNAAIFPRRFNGDWVMLHRPVISQDGPKADIWASRSEDLMSWRAPSRVMASRKGAWWDSLRLGIGPPPIETPDGWLLIYHGVKDTVGGSLYRVGLALLDLEEPTKVIRRSPSWVLGPEAPYERVGDVPNVVFPCGLVHDPAHDQLRVYYGAADSVICLATGRLSEVMEYLLGCPIE